MAKVIFKDNIFEGKEESFFFHANTLREVIEKLALQNKDFAKDLETGGNVCFIVTVNGLSVDNELWNLYPLQPNDEVVVSYDVGWAVGLALVEGLIGAVFTPLVTFAISLVVFAINYFTQPKPPREGGQSVGDFTSTSPTYNWTGIVTTYDVDRPIAVPYGKHAYGGNLIFEGGNAR
jgi:hypothetical protein